MGGPWCIHELPQIRHSSVLKRMRMVVVILHFHGMGLIVGLGGKRRRRRDEWEAAESDRVVHEKAQK